MLVKNIIVNIIVFACHCSRCSPLLEWLYFTMNMCQVARCWTKHKLFYSLNVPNMFDKFNYLNRFTIHKTSWKHSQLFSLNAQISAYKLLRGWATQVQRWRPDEKLRNFQGMKFQVWNTHSKTIRYYLQEFLRKTWVGFTM